MKKILRKHGIIALVLAVLWVLAYLHLNSINGGLDRLADAIVAAVLLAYMTGAFVLNLFLLAADALILRAAPKGKVRLSRLLAGLYTCALLYVIYSAFAFSDGQFFTYLAEGDFFAVLYLSVMLVLVLMIIIRLMKTRRLQAAS